GRERVAPSKRARRAEIALRYDGSFAATLRHIPERDLPRIAGFSGALPDGLTSPSPAAWSRLSACVFGSCWRWFSSQAAVVGTALGSQPLWSNTSPLGFRERSCSSATVYTRRLLQLE